MANQGAASSCCGEPPDKRQEAECGHESVSAESSREPRSSHKPWVKEMLDTPVGEVPRVSATLTKADRLGSWKAYWGIGRMRFRVEPGLYAVGRPTQESPILVSANYKMSFDHLRSQLGGLDAWILVLETQGINVWCAAGKGTFGTDEIVTRVTASRLSEVVSHRRLIVPQLGAPGVAAHEVARRCGFRVVFGPVRAADLPAFLGAGMKATPRMRRVRFPIRDRVVLIPVELVGGAKHALLVATAFLVLAGLGPQGYSFDRVVGAGARDAALFLATAVAAVVITPIFLPWLPGRPFSVKGLWVGLLMALALGGYALAHPGAFGNWQSAAAWLLMIPSVSSFVAMNFTGASTYTSLSGVRREMRVALPVQIACAVVGASLWIAGRFF
ncbi:MAG: hypothetical protein JSU63_00610 [Phycisphaerales bacterium]|nr:MAG: hypothetical protein JSU63_00610 [Phycisphaerales bacterium]